MKLRNPISLLIDVVRTWWHDEFRWNRNKLNIKGDWRAFNKFAILACFSGSTPPDSVLATCTHLESHGYGVLLVSNCPLSKTFVQDALKHCAGVMQRQNWGYDFGAYRDGIHYLEKNGLHPESLILLNDSIYYPLGDDDSLLSWVEASTANFTGAVFVREGRDRGLRKRKPVLGSFFLHFDHVALGSTAFRKFWKDYRLTNSKTYAVRNGEHRLSDVLRADGVTLDAMLSWGGVQSRVAQLSEGGVVLETELFPQLLDCRGKRQSVIQGASAFAVSYLGLTAIKRTDNATVRVLHSLKRFPSTRVEGLSPARRVQDECITKGFDLIDPAREKS